MTAADCLSELEENGRRIQEVAARMAPPLRGGAVYTDDKAPVEWLTDLSILRYAIGKR